jgi:endonuclease YncB( thermonuclease family)
MGSVHSLKRSQQGSMFRTALRFAMPVLLFAAAFGLVHALFIQPDSTPPSTTGSGPTSVSASSSGAGGRHVRSHPATLDARAIDGDSLRGSGGDIRIMDIDAPELRQTCRDAQGRNWECGRAAHQRLKELSEKGALACRERGRDRYGRTLADCTASGVRDIGETLVREGLAVDFGRGAYSAAEREARNARRGIWSGDFQRPQDWRRDNPRRDDRRRN